MKLYELTYLISSNLSEEEKINLSEKITGIIQENGGILKESRSSVKRSLLKPVKGKFDVFSITLDFHSNPEKIEDIENKIKSEPQILRYIILAKAAPRAKPRVREKTPKITKEALVKKERKVELKEIEKKLEEILGENKI